MSETSSNAIPAYLPLRNDLIGEEPYGAPQLDVPVCLNVNENPYAPEPAVVETIAQRVKEIAPTLNRYLERESGVKLSVDQLWGANGSNEIMLQLFQAFGGPGRIALGCDPTYSMYPEYARDTFTTWKLAHRNADFTLDVDATIKAIEDVKPAMIVLTSPNNPTGTPLKPEDLKRVLEAARTAEVAGAAEGVHPVVVVDEAYIEFRDPGTPTALELIGEYENLAVSRTMSKAFAFAGARVGYLAANKGIIDCVRIVRMPYHLSAVTQAAALAAFEHTDEQLSRVAHLRETRNVTSAWLKEQTYKGQPLEVAETQSNFILFGGHFDDRDRIFDELLKRGVLIRVVEPERKLGYCPERKFVTVFGNKLETEQNRGGCGRRNHRNRNIVAVISQLQHRKRSRNMARTATIVRETSESKVELSLNLDGTGKTDIDTSVPFYNHMMTALGKHSLIDLKIKATGDTDIDAHHTVEDIAIVFGEALKQALGDKRGIRRFADATVPLDEALAKAVVDISGRPYCVCTGEPEGFEYCMIGGHFTGSLVRHVMESIAMHAGICLHLHVISGRDPHHIAEAEFKALARALRFAIEPDPRVDGIPSTKGAL